MHLRPLPVYTCADCGQPAEVACCDDTNGARIAYCCRACGIKNYFRIGDRDTCREIREKVTGKILTPADTGGSPGPRPGGDAPGAPRPSGCVRR